MLAFTGGSIAIGLVLGLTIYDVQLRLRGDNALVGVNAWWQPTSVAGEFAMIVVSVLLIALTLFYEVRSRFKRKSK